MNLAEFRYELPEDSIAQRPAEPRDSSRLLDTRRMLDHRFSELPELLNEGDLVVVNRTRVRRARLFGKRVPTGGRIELLLLNPRGDGSWEVLARPSRRLRVGSRIDLGSAEVDVVAGPEDGRVVVQPVSGSLDLAMATSGEVPLPPYIKGSLDDIERYQTVYSTEVGSAAAPTAGLHFTRALLQGLRDRGIGVAELTLNVGLDTFRPIATDQIEDHVMHSEQFAVGQDVVEAVGETRERGGRVVAIGTTVVRALESAAIDGDLAATTAATDLFISPGYRFRVVDLLVTNFHVPGSTLVVLIAAFMGERWRSAYETALARGYRFLSFGDAMLIERSS